MENIISFFVKSFAVVVGFIYLIYTVVLQKQTSVMMRSLETRHNNILGIISAFQILAAVILIVLAFLWL